MAGAFESTEANELVQNTYEELHYFVRNLLGPGCYILASKPKLGKSFWSLQLGVSLVSGQPFMDTFETSKAGICLLQLEDGLKRAQRRLWLLADEIPKGMRIVEEAERLDTGLLDQIRRDLESHPETGVYVIDTFAAVRPPGEEYSYQTDYAHAKSLADFGTENGVCIVLVHHCRKTAGFGDSFDDISGTNGLTAGATGMVVLAKDQRDSGKVIMTAKGKDVEEGSWRIEFAGSRWRMVEPMTARDIASCTVPECVLTTVRWMESGPAKWAGTTTKLLAEVGAEGVSGGAYGKYLTQHRGFMLDSGVDYKRRHTRSGNIVTLIRTEKEGDDGEQ